MQIYKTINKVNGKFYIGKNKTSSIAYLGSGILLHRAIQKYGIENFSKIILEEVETLEELNEREKFWIAKYRTDEAYLMYNLASGGDGGDTNSGRIWSDDIRKHMSDSRKGEKHPNWGRTSGSSGKPWNDESRARLVKFLTGRKQSAETVSKRAATRKLHVIENRAKGIVEIHPLHTEETKKKMSDKQKNRAPISEETRLKMVYSAKHRAPLKKERKRFSEETLLKMSIAAKHRYKKTLIMSKEEGGQTLY